MKQTTICDTTREVLAVVQCGNSQITVWAEIECFTQQLLLTNPVIYLLDYINQLHLVICSYKQFPTVGKVWEAKYANKKEGCFDSIWYLGFLHLLHH